MNIQGIDVVLIKLGGSLITDKTVEKAFRQSEMARVAAELAAVYYGDRTPRLLIGHGSGSFGHFMAQRHGTIHGVKSNEDWQGFANVAAVAAELNKLVIEELLRVGIPAISFQPSASAICRNGQLSYMSITAIESALVHRLVPVVYGDVGFDQQRGGTIISTEMIFEYLTANMPVKQIILLGEVDGVLDDNGETIATISDESFPELKASLGKSRGTDVTGGMLSKVKNMLNLSRQHADLEIQICDGRKAGLIETAIFGPDKPGTRIRA